MRKKSGIFDDGHKLAVGSHDSTPKSAVFSVRRGLNGLATYVQTKKSRGFATWGRHACYRRPNFLVGSLADVVYSCQVWFESVHFCRRYGGKTLPEEAKVITLAWHRLANNIYTVPEIN